MTAATLASFLPIAALALPQSEPTPKKERSEAARVQRLAEQKAELEAELAAIEKFGHLDEFLAKVKSIADSHEPDVTMQPGFPVATGFLHYSTIEQYAEWQSPSADRTLVSAVDFEQKNHPLAAIVDLEKQLRAHGIDLLVVTFPTRLELYPELLLPLAEMNGFGGMGIGTARFLLELNRAGVETLSLNAAFVAARFGADDDRTDQLFLRSDPHWTPRGAELAAQLVAERIAKYPWFVHGPAHEGRAFQIVAATFTHTSSEELAAAGAQPEVVKANFVMHDEVEVQPIRKDSRLMMIGDSFVRIHEHHGADICSQLLRFTGCAIDEVHAPGGAGKACRDKLRLRTADEWHAKKLLIWLLPDSSFHVNEEWTPIALFPQ